MSDTLKIVLTSVLASGALFGFFGVLATLYFTKGRTTAEAGKFDADADKAHADASKTEAEATQIYLSEIRASIGQWKTVIFDLAECMAGKSAAEARWREEATERERIEKYAEGLRLQMVSRDAEITRLNGEVAELRKGL